MLLSASVHVANKYETGMGYQVDLAVVVERVAQKLIKDLSCSHKS